MGSLITIAGSGLSGMLAAALERRARVIESASTPRAANHRAVLRFRSDRISQALNIPFRRVRVIKAVESESGELLTSLTPRLANLYSMKVSGTISSRSILNLDPVERYIAPFDFHEQLLDMVGPGRIEYDCPLDEESVKDLPRPLISTIPLDALCLALKIKTPLLLRSPIYVRRFKVSNCDAYQTIYHPRQDTPIYRTTLTGGLLIIEAMKEFSSYEELPKIVKHFGLIANGLTTLDSGFQEFGKIDPLPDETRKPLLHRITVQHSIFSLGRFATWRNVLLDDVLDDFYTIRKMIEVGDYDLMKRSAAL